MPACTRPSASIPTRRPSRRLLESTSFESSFDIPKVVAVGETGLDTVRGFATPAQQRRLFDAHLGLADELKLPVVVHNREADDEAAAALAAVCRNRRPPLLLVTRARRSRRRPGVLRVLRGQCDLPEGFGSA